jgi:hypothetical protein
MFLHILDEQRVNVLSQIISVQQESFYLAGGTSLALQLGHRDSIDFDWFSDEVIDLDALSNSLSELGSYRESYKQKNTLHAFLNRVQLSYLYYPVKRLEPLVKSTGEQSFFLAGILDIALMKLVAISQRGAKKDFIDLYAIMNTKDYTWKFLFDSLYKKFENRPPNPYHLARSLVYFDDAELEPTPKMYVDWGWEHVKHFLIHEQHAYSKVLFQMGQ